MSTLNSPPTHICVNCEENKRSMLVSIDVGGKCVVCGSDSVLPAAIFLSLAEKEKKVVQAERKLRSDVENKSLAESKRKRIDTLEAYHRPVRLFLQRNKLHDLNLWWDGWGFHTDSSCFPMDPDDAPEDGQFEWSKLTLANSDGSYKTLVCFFDAEEEGRIAVSEVKRDFPNKK